MIDILYLSHINFDWRSTEIYRSARFLDRKNAIKILSDDNVVGNFYSSLEDLEIKHSKIQWMIDRCREIVLVGISYDNLLIDLPADSVPIYSYLISSLKRAGKYKATSFKNLYLLEPWKTLVPSRPCDDPVLWIGGCSVSEGFSVDITERYAQKLSLSIDMPLVVLAEGGSSIFRQFDRWLSADIRPGDVLVWGLTNLSRIDVLVGDQLKKITSNAYDILPDTHRYWDLDFFNSPTQAIISVKQILQFENYCKKIGIRDYFLVNLLDDTWLPLILNGHDRFLDLTKSARLDGLGDFVDFGRDNKHPGPKQHSIYAEQIKNIIKSKK